MIVDNNILKVYHVYFMNLFSLPPDYIILLSLHVFLHFSK